MDRGVGLVGQQVLDIGTGTGVLPRNLYKYGAHWLGVDPSPQQIAEARRLSDGLDIDYQVCAAEAVEAPDGSFDAITVCQCYWYLIRLGRPDSLPGFFLRGQGVAVGDELAAL